MKDKSKRTHKKIEPGSRLSNLIYGLSLTLLFLIPLVFSTSVQAVYALPKFILLLVGATLLALLLAIQASRPHQLRSSLFQSNQVRLVSAYFLVMALTTFFSVAPRVSLFGSSSNFMGLITRLCFLVCFFGLFISIGANPERFLKTLWVMAISGGLVATYAVAQFFGLDLFAPARLYTFQTSMGDVIRVCGSIGHSNYLGNFLLYITPLSAGLALASGKRERLLAVFITAISLLAIVFSVARGAWVGILVGTIFFMGLEWKRLPALRMVNRNALLRYAAVFLLAVAAMASVIALTPASRTIKERVQALREQGVQSSGRLLLWRDSLKMLPAYGLTGFGTEGFRKAFLTYKSKEVAKLSQPNNNESSHNSYLDVALSHGLLGFVLYLGIIIFSLRAFLRARQRAPSESWRLIISGLLCSFVAVLAHNFFIFDQLSTGLYFYAFVALAAVAEKVFSGAAMEAKVSTSSQASQAGKADGKAQDLADARPNQGRPLSLWAGRAASALAGLALLVAVWYVAGLIEAERAFGKIFDPAIARNFQAISKRCEETANSPMPTGAYQLAVAKALDTYGQGLLSLANTAGPSSPERNNVLATRSSALQLGIAYAEQSLAHTNTPDLNYNTLASLAMAYGDKARLQSAAAEAVRSDPNNFYCRWLLAEAFLANGDSEQAANEANLALELAPQFTNAQSVLQRAQTQTDELKARQKLEAQLKPEAQLAQNSNEPGRSVPQMIDYARQLTLQGNLQKAKRKLLMALARTQGDCLDCRSRLAEVYEKLGLYSAAIAEWEKVARHTSDPTSIEQIYARLETLRNGSLEKQK
jgi:O-antigen ligase/tetratricopeptide (TPR) repeat protein